MKANWKDTAEFVGIAAIVASLVFVGLQLRQSQEIAVAAQYQARYDSVLSQVNANLESDAALSYHGKLARKSFESNPASPPTLLEWINETSDAEIGVALYWSYLALKSFDNLYFQYEAGFLDPESWTAARAELKRDLANPVSAVSTREYYENDRTIWRNSYRDLVDGILAEIDGQNR